MQKRMDSLIRFGFFTISLVYLGWKVGVMKCAKNMIDMKIPGTFLKWLENLIQFITELHV